MKATQSFQGNDVDLCRERPLRGRLENHPSQPEQPPHGAVRDVATEFPFTWG